MNCNNRLRPVLGTAADSSLGVVSPRHHADAADRVTAFRDEVRSPVTHAPTTSHHLPLLLLEQVFLDSDNLKNLRRLEQHVRDSECLVIVQTPHFLLRPCAPAARSHPRPSERRSTC